MEVTDTDVGTLPGEVRATVHATRDGQPAAPGAGDLRRRDGAHRQGRHRDRLHHPRAAGALQGVGAEGSELRRVGARAGRRRTLSPTGACDRLRLARRLILRRISILVLTLLALGGSAVTSATAQPDLPPVDLSRADSCDFIGEQEGSLCLLPFPDDYYTVPTTRRATGRRVNLSDAGDAAERRPARRSTPPPTTSTTASAPARPRSSGSPGLDSAGGVRSDRPGPAQRPRPVRGARARTSRSS